MAFRKMLPLMLLATLVLVPSAEAKYRVGVGDQSAAMFDSSRWQSLKLKRTRYLVPWNWHQSAAQVAETTDFMNRARAARQQVLVTFTARRGCWNGRRYSRSRACRAPSAKAYKNAFARFDNRFPWVRTYSSWNEVNHASQPTNRKPGLAVRYYEVLRKLARKRKFKVMAADVLDTSNMARYLRSFLRRAKGSPRLWGLHNYQDVNYRTSKDTRRMLQTVPGQVWLTETGGIARFGRLKFSTSRQAKRTKWMFTLANRYDSRRRGMRSKITQLYVYRWFGEARGARFDAGLVSAGGTPRKAYRVFARTAKRHR
jgi:Glycosyl hydrolase catalytic core